MRTKRIAINWFVDFDKEEKWINDMAKRGWAFWHKNGMIYRFKKCEPNEFIYQIDFDEKKSKNGMDDYVAFRSACGDRFVHQWKQRIYWKRETAAGPFEAENNVAAKLRMTNKAFSHHLNSLIGLTLIAAFSFLFLMPLGKCLPESGFSIWLTEFSIGFTYGIMLAELFLLVPIVKKLHKKINELTRLIF